MSTSTGEAGMFKRSAVALMVVSLGMGTVLAVAPPASAQPTAPSAGSASQRYEQQITVSGSVKTADGVPFVGVSWEVTDANGDIQRGSTSSTGEFSFEADATQEALITFGSTWSGALRGTVTVPAGQSEIAIATGQAHKSTIEVVDTFGAPLRNAKVALPQSLSNATWDVPGYPTLKVHGPISPGSNYNTSPTTTDALGRVRITTAGALPVLPDGILGTVTTTTSPGSGMASGSTVSQTVKSSELTGSDPLNRRVRVTSSLAPIMEDTRVAGVNPAAPADTSGEVTSEPRVIVRKPDGTPIPNVPVQLVRVLDGDTPEAPKEDTTYLRTATTDAEGKASFSYTESLPAGRYRAISTPYSGVSSRAVDFSVKSTVSAPTIYSVEAGDGSAQVFWSSHYNPTGAQPTGYTVTSDPGGATCETTSWWQSYCTVEGLENGTEYRFTVTAHYADGTDSISAPSAPATPQTVAILDRTTLTYPSDGSAWKFKLSERQLVTMTVDGLEGEPSEDEPGFTIIPDGGYWHNGAHASRNGVHRVILERGSYRAYGEWPRETPWSVKLETGPVPADSAGDTVDDALALAFGTPAKDTVSWASTGGWEEPWAVSDADLFRVVLPHKGRIEAELTDLPADFDLTLQNSKGENIDVSSNAGKSDELISRPLAAGTYYLKVASGSGEWSDTPYTLVAHATAAAPGTPAATVDETTAHLTWAKPESTGGLPVQGYRIERRVGSGDWETAIRDTGSTATTGTINNLSTDATTRFRVAAINSIGTSEPSAASQPVIGVKVDVPGAPIGLTATAGNARAELSWQAPASDGGAPITGYTVTGGGRTWSTTGTSLTADGLTNGNAYTFTVTATNKAGTSAASAASNSVTPMAPVTAPGAPHNVHASSVVSTSTTHAHATVSWSAPADGGSPITGYTVTMSPGGQVQHTTGTSATFSGLKPGTNYTFGVVAHTDAGTSAPGTVTVTPPAPKVHVSLKPVSSNGKLYVNVDPNRGSGYYTFKVQYKDRHGNWKTYNKTYKTYGSGETNTLNFGKGTYRVVVNGKYGYQGATSNEVHLRK